MSLKAKIEAVIYASEEPVTLAQLVGLLGHEAQAELDREVSAQQSFLLEEADATPELSLTGDQPAKAPNEPSVGDVVESIPPTEQEAPEPESVVPESSASENLTDEAQATTEVETADPAPMDEATAAAQAAVDAVTAARAERAKAARLRAHFRDVLDQLIADYAAPESDRGLEIREVAGGFRFATKPEYHDAVRGFVKSLKPPLKLTLQALETLAVVAYKQPVTAPEISEIRGVDSGGVLGSLMARKLITTAGRKQVIGRPILYKTTREFLLKFGLKDVAELPSIEEFEKMASQLDEQEEIALPEHESPEPDTSESAEQTEPVRDAYAPLVESESAPADNVAEETGDKASVDGRIASLPPNYDDMAEDPSAAEAGIQADETQENSPRDSENS